MRHRTTGVSFDTNRNCHHVSYAVFSLLGISEATIRSFRTDMGTSLENYSVIFFCWPHGEVHNVYQVVPLHRPTESLNFERESTKIWAQQRNIFKIHTRASNYFAYDSQYFVPHAVAKVLGLGLRHATEHTLAKKPSRPIVHSATLPNTGGLHTACLEGVRVGPIARHRALRFMQRGLGFGAPLMQLLSCGV
eukprot:824640-Amphidinium_carterae.1